MTFVRPSLKKDFQLSCELSDCEKLLVFYLRLFISSLNDILNYILILSANEPQWYEDVVVKAITLIVKNVRCLVPVDYLKILYVELAAGMGEVEL